jgi:hypothetical protein
MVKNTSFTIFFTVCILIALGVESCVSHDLEPAFTVDCNGFNTVSFANDIQPILQANCAIPDCHNGDNGAAIDWRDADKFKAHAEEAKRRVALPKTHGDHMPRVGEITDAQISSIVCWAEQGAPINN